MTETPISPLAPETSPLTEADANSINELIQNRINDIFNKKQVMLTDDDLKVAVEYYRRERQRFMQESAAKIANPPKTKRKAPVSVADALSSTADLL